MTNWKLWNGNNLLNMLANKLHSTVEIIQKTSGKNYLKKISRQIESIEKKTNQQLKNIQMNILFSQIKRKSHHLKEVLPWSQQLHHQLRKVFQCNSEKLIIYW
jgi:hypothetical protein